MTCFNLSPRSLLAVCLSGISVHFGRRWRWLPAAQVGSEAHRDHSFRVRALHMVGDQGLSEISKGVGPNAVVTVDNFRRGTYDPEWIALVESDALEPSAPDVA